MVEDIPLDAFVDAVRAEGHVLTWEHTLSHWPRELYIPGPALDRSNRDQWEKLPPDQRSERGRLRHLVEEALEGYQGPPVDEARHREMRRILQAAVGDTPLPPVHIEVSVRETGRARRRRRRRR